MWQKSTGLICIMLTNKWSQINGPKKKRVRGISAMQRHDSSGDIYSSKKRIVRIPVVCLVLRWLGLHVGWLDVLGNGVGKRVHE